MKIGILGAGPLARSCMEAVKVHPGWEMAERDERPDWMVLCGPEELTAAELSQLAREAGGVLCVSTAAWGEESGAVLGELMAQKRARALRPECFREHVAGVRNALESQWLGTVGAAHLTRRRPLALVGGCRDALSQCGMEEASVLLSLLGRPERLFCVVADLGEGEQVSLTLQMPNGAVANIQGIQRVGEEAGFQYEYAGQFGLADYDSRQGALRLSRRGTLLEEWPVEASAKALEEALTCSGDNGLEALVHLQLCARRSAGERRVVEWKEGAL